MCEMCLWMKAVPLTPVSSNTHVINTQAQSSVSHSAHVHKTTLLQSAMSLTNGKLTQPLTCGRANVVSSTMGRRLLPSGPFHKNWMMFLSNRHSACDGAGAAESTLSTVGAIIVHTIHMWFWRDSSCFIPSVLSVLWRVSCWVCCGLWCGVRT